MREWIWRERETETKNLFFPVWQLSDLAAGLPGRCKECLVSADTKHSFGNVRHSLLAPAEHQPRQAGSPWNLLPFESPAEADTVSFPPRHSTECTQVQVCVS